MSQTFCSFNLPSRSTSTSASAKSVRSDFADAVSDASAATVEYKEFKYASKSDIGAADFDAASLPLESVSGSALALSLDVMCFECARKLTEERSLHLVAQNDSRSSINLSRKKIK